jgi:hypothetical protein
VRWFIIPVESGIFRASSLPFVTADFTDDADLLTAEIAEIAKSRTGEFPFLCVLCVLCG